MTVYSFICAPESGDTRRDVGVNTHTSLGVGVACEHRMSSHLGPLY